MELPGGGGDQLDMDWLQRSVEAYAGCAISVKKVDWNPVQIKGRLDRYQLDGAKTADIILSEKLNTCWTRFVGCKEMCHLIIDTKDGTIDSQYQVAAAEDAKKVIEEMIAVNNVAQVALSLPHLSEILARHCAVELLFPVTVRQAAVEGLEREEGVARQQIITQLAHKYKLPRHHVDQSLKPYYMEFWGGYALRAHNEVFG